MTSIKAFDFFAGIGGFRVGAKKALNGSLSFSGYCEIDDKASATYEMANRCKDERRIKDIQALTRGEDGNFLSSKKIKENTENLPNFNLFLGGFPCQPHSLMGKRLGENDERGELAWDIIEVLRHARPQHLILENVRQIKSVNGGGYFKRLMGALQDDLGYKTTVHILNARDFGTPQVRRRIFITAGLKKKPEGIPKTVNLEATKYPTTWHLLEKNAEDKYYLSERILKTILADQKKGYCRKADINRLIARPLTKTMHKMHRASQDNYYSDSFLHGKLRGVSVLEKDCDILRSRIRRITPREAFRIQSFSEEWINRAISTEQSDTQYYMQAGNAVPPCMVSAVVSALFSQ